MSWVKVYFHFKCNEVQRSMQLKSKHLKFDTLNHMQLILFAYYSHPHN